MPGGSMRAATSANSTSTRPRWSRICGRRAMPHLQGRHHRLLVWRLFRPAERHPPSRPVCRGGRAVRGGRREPCLGLHQPADGCSWEGRPPTADAAEYARLTAAPGGTDPDAAVARAWPAGPNAAEQYQRAAGLGRGIRDAGGAAGVWRRRPRAEQSQQPDGGQPGHDLVVRAASGAFGSASHSSAPRGGTAMNHPHDVVISTTA